MDAPAVTPYFGLHKTWVDPGPGIAMVQAHYTWSARDAAPDWTDAEQVVLAPQGDGLRTAVLEVPRRDDDYALHHFFFVVGTDDRAASPVFTEEVVSAEVTWIDHGGELTAVGLVWSFTGAAVPNYTSAVMDGLPFETMGDAPDEGSLYEFVRAQPLPHTFRGRVWGVRGTSVRYAVHLIRHGQPDPAEDDESWDDNGGQGWIVSL